MEINQQIWEQLIEFSQNNPLKIEALQKNYDIKKLELNKYQAVQIRAKQLELANKRQRDEENVTKNWLENQYKLFVWFIFTYAHCYKQKPTDLNQSFWKSVGLLFNKDSQLCQYFFSCSIKNKTEIWAPEEDQLVKIAMENPSLQKKWTQIGFFMFVQSKGIFVRKAKAIRERWLSHLNPSIKKSQWTPEEDLEFFSLVLEHGKKWSKISRMVCNRSEHTIKNRYNKVIVRNLKKKEIKNSEIAQEQAICQYLSTLKGKLNRSALSEAVKKVSHEQRTFKEPHSVSSFVSKSEESKDGGVMSTPNELQNQNKPFQATIIFQPIILTLNCFSI